jgi:hypothetical protein
VGTAGPQVGLNGLFSMSVTLPSGSDPGLSTTTYFSGGFGKAEPPGAWTRPGEPVLLGPELVT